MIKINKKDLSLEPKIISTLSSDSGNSGEDDDTMTMTKNDYCKVNTNDCTLNTFNSVCLCQTNNSDCDESVICANTVSGGDICCAVTNDDDSGCVVETNDGCIVPITQDGCDITSDCPETETCLPETVVDC